MTRKLICYVTCLFARTFAYALAAEQVVLRGCLQGAPDNVFFGVAGKPELYHLTGNTAALTKYLGKEVSLAGSVNESTPTWPSFRVVSLKQVFAVSQPVLSASFTDSSLWQQEKDARYGIIYAHPRDWTRFADSEGSMVHPSFAANDRTVSSARLGYHVSCMPRVTSSAARLASL